MSTSEIFHWPLSNGDEVCRYADHVAAVAEAVSLALNADQDRRIAAKVTFLDGVEQGQRDAIAKAVAFLRDPHNHPSDEAAAWALAYAEALEHRRDQGSA